MKFLNTSLLSFLLLGASPSLAEITLVADPAYPASAAAFTLDPEQHSAGARGLTNGRQLRQTFKLSQRTIVNEIVISMNMVPSNNGMTVKIYEVSDTLSSTWSPGALVKTIIFDPSVDLPDTDVTLGILLTDDDVFTLEPSLGTAGYGIEIVDGGGSIGVIRHSNSGSDVYPDGIFYKEGGNISSAVRDVGVAIGGTADTTVGPNDPPGFAIQPASTSVLSSDSVTLAALADSHPDAGTVTYQWRLNGSNIAGATAGSLTIESATAANAGDYTVVASNSNGSGTSAAATLFVVSDIPNLLFNTGVNASGALLADGATDPHYQITTNPDSELADAIVIDSTTAPVAGPWSPNTADSKWIGPRLTGGSATGNYTYTTTFDLSGYDVSTVAISGDWTSDNGGVDILVNGISTGISRNDFTTVGSFQIAPGSFLSGTNTLDFIVNNNGAGSTGFKVENLRIGGNAGAAASSPVILVQPEDSAVSFQSDATFTVLADGAATLAYQWRFNGANIAGANSSSLTISEVTEANLGSYDLVVSNGQGSVTSDAAELTILVEPPVIDAQPDNQFSAVDEAATFSLDVSGRTPMTYQWRLNGVNIPDATSANLVIEPVALTDDGASYDVVITNVDGTTTSNAATLRAFPDRVPGVFATGLDNDGNLLEDGIVNSHFTLTANANGPETEPVAIANIHSAWVRNTAQSRWIGPGANAQGEPGTYTYQTTFSLTGFDINTITLLGSLALDDGILEARLNGNFVDLPAAPRFDSFTDFEINTGFIDGVNTLEFDVRNGGSSPNPTGLHLKTFAAFGVDLNLKPLVITEIIYSNSPQSATITWDSISNASYTIEASTDLQNWLELDDGITSEKDSITHVDTFGIFLGPKVFYRVRLQE